jgi:hypothetical protein
MIQRPIKSRFSPNLDRTGRFLRGVTGLACLIAGALSLPASPWIGGPLLLFGIFGLFEAFRGWCALRACGIRTRW